MRTARAARAALAVLLTIAVPVRAETTTDPLWYLLSTVILAPDAKAVEGAGVGLADAKGLASLQSDLLLLSDGFESFRDETQVKETLERLEPRLSPDLRPFFKDRSSSLDVIYRTLAVVDYTWAGRFPEPPCAPFESRGRLLAAPDGLFQNESGLASPWLVSLLGPAAEGKSAESALDQASARSKMTSAEYERRRAQVRRLTLALASDKAVGAARSRLYCSRAAAFEDLAAHHRDQDRSAVLASRSVVQDAPEESVFVVVSNSRRCAATLLQTKSGRFLLTDASIVEDGDHPRLIAFSRGGKGMESQTKVIRRDPDLGLAVLELSEERRRTPLGLGDTKTPKGDLVSAVGHSDVSGLWTKTSGLVTKSGTDSFQTDAAISDDFSGGPVLNEAGEVAGILVLRRADTEEGSWPVAVPAATIARWLEGGVTTVVPASEVIEDAGTAAILNRTRPSGLIETAGEPWVIPPLPPPPPVPNGVCVQYCHDQGPSRPPRSSKSTISSGPSYDSGNAELGQALGKLGAVLVLEGIPALFRGIGKLFRGKEKSSSQALVDNRHNADAAPIREAPKPPPDPLKPASLVLSVSRVELAQGEEVDAVATVGFSGKDGSRSGHAVAFTIVPGGILNCPPGRTDGSGIARVTCRAVVVEMDRRFDGLQDETRRRLGMKTAGRVPGKPAKGDKIAELKERFAANQDKLVVEEERHPLTGTDTPGIDKVFPETEHVEFVIKGDRVTLGATLGKFEDQAKLNVLERPCPVAAKCSVVPGNRVAGALECRCSLGNRVGNLGHEYSEGPGDKGEAKPFEGGPGEKLPTPANLPPGAVENVNRPGSWGELDENGKFRERWRIDPGTPGAPKWGGRDHVHIDGGEDHLPVDTPYPENKP